MQLELTLLSRTPEQSGDIKLLFTLKVDLTHHHTVHTEVLSNLESFDECLIYYRVYTDIGTLSGC